VERSIDHAADAVPTPAPGTCNPARAAFADALRIALAARAALVVDERGSPPALLAHSIAPSVVGPLPSLPDLLARADWREVAERSPLGEGARIRRHPLLDGGRRIGELWCALDRPERADLDEPRFLEQMAQVALALFAEGPRAEAGRAVGPLRQTVATLASLIESSPMAIYSVDTEHLVRSWNPAAERMFGFSAAEVLGRRLPIITESVRSEYERIFRRVIAGESIHDLQLERRKADGSKLLMSLWAAPLPGEDGSAQGVLAIALDVTGRRRMELELRQAQKLEAVGRLAGGVAHDFNNLLTAILSYGQFLQRRVADNFEAARDVGEIVLAARRAAALTQQLLTFSRRGAVRPRAVFLTHVVDGLASMLRRLLPEGIALVTELEPATPPVRIDPGQCEQVVMNLALNARDAMPEGGTLTIEVAPLGPDRVCLRVRDDGVGMDEATAAQAFDPFFTTKADSGGTGLGLATVREIVESAKGTIELRSLPGRGSTFTITLPRTERSGEVLAVPSPALRVPPATILLVEDDPAVREVARRALEMSGHRVLLAERPDDAERLAEGWIGALELLVSDIVMPGVRGPALYERLRARRPDLAVLFMTGYADAKGSDGAPLAETALLQKPFTPEQLADRVAALLLARIEPPAIE
jgi:two-component system cell cycle sensor histidine kinase/response regulator CckA